MSLNILCGICNEYFGNDDVIYSTRCGHIFHKRCLFQWLESSITCPQCRQYCVQCHCHQLFINFVERSIDNENDVEKEYPRSYEWIYLDPEYIEPHRYLIGALSFGKDEYDNDIYAARVHFNGDLLPAHYAPQLQAISAAWGSEAQTLVTGFELLNIGDDNAEYKWVAASDGDIPDNAFATGRSIHGDILYTARAEYNGMILYGKLHQRYRMAFMPYKHEEVSNSNYEVLVRIPLDQRLTMPSVNSNSTNTSDSTN